MSKRKQSKNRNIPNKPMRNILITAAIAIFLLTGILVSNGLRDSSDNSGNDIVINKSEITGTVKFIPTKVGRTSMEIIAVKASDDTIRTAFNTCQVCNGSAKAYYKQDGEMIVCQNCGNRFSTDLVGFERGGCNPIPILKEDKTDNGDTITISQEFLAKNKGLFTYNWKSQ